MNDEMFTEIWLMARGYMDKNHIDTAAEHYVGLIMEYVNDTDMLNDMRGADTSLDIAIETYIEAHEPEEDM